MRPPLPLLVAGLVGCGDPAPTQPAERATSPAPQPTPSAERELPVEAPVRPLLLAGPLAGADAELSGLAWDGERLLLLPQYPDFAGVPTIYALTRAEIEAHLVRARPGPLTPAAIPLDEGDLSTRIAGFRGYEAIAVSGDVVWLTIEAEAGDGGRGHVVAGALAADRSAITLDPTSLAAVPAQTRLRNFAEEALVLAGDRLLVLHEVNGVGVNPRPVAHAFDLALTAATPLAMYPLEYRLTDATALDADGRFWVINYFFPREAALRPVDDPIAREFGEGRSHAAHATVERLVELELRGDAVVRGPTPPIALELLGDHASRNWEGVVRLGERGFLLATDRHPGTLLVFVARP